MLSNPSAPGGVKTIGGIIPLQMISVTTLLHVIIAMQSVGDAARRRVIGLYHVGGRVR